MYKKPFLAIVFLFISTLISIGQVNETVLSSPDNWKGEIIPFPLGFAPEIGLVGFEDLRFAPGWNDPDSQEFWAYLFIWYVELDSAMTESKLTEYFQSYYDGLMGVDENNKRDTTGANQLDKTISLFIKTNEGFVGKIRTYDRFFTKDYITLNIKVAESCCLESNKQIIRCELSSKVFEHEVWKIFEDVKIKVKCD